MLLLLLFSLLLHHSSCLPQVQVQGTYNLELVQAPLVEGLDQFNVQQPSSQFTRVSR